MRFCRGFWTINNFREAAFLSRNRGIHEAKAGSKSTAVADLLACQKFQQQHKNTTSSPLRLQHGTESKNKKQYPNQVLHEEVEDGQQQRTKKHKVQAAGFLC